tara:strand:+ start:911 stop:1381 length:471 start_codon:yes stop_codon:yes gene_type:complete
MATINATISVSSADLTSSALALSNSMTMTKAGTNTGLEFTSGLVRRKLTSRTAIDLVTVGEQMYGTPTSAGANKLYIKNTGSSSTDYVDVAIGDSSGDPAPAEELLGTSGASFITLGKLFGGDWMLIPFQGSANNDIVVTPSTAEATTIEWMLFFE